MPATVPYRPPRVTPKALVHGTQTAVVVGPAGEEIYVDKYGRVKVQFYWDRQGKKDDKSSCWVRVSSTWAGKQWGFIQIPRIGQEVIVDFLEGDPDRPIIVGRVYNAEQMPPYELPANKTQSGVKIAQLARAAPRDFNEIRFEDKKGSEQVLVHAEKDYDDRGRERRDALGRPRSHEDHRPRRDDARQARPHRDRRQQRDDHDPRHAHRDGRQGRDDHHPRRANGDGRQGRKHHDRRRANRRRSRKPTSVTVGDAVDAHRRQRRVDHDRRRPDAVDGQGPRRLGRRRRYARRSQDAAPRRPDASIAIEATQGIELKVGQNSIKIDQIGHHDQRHAR